MKNTFKIILFLSLIMNGYHSAYGCAWTYGSLLDGVVIQVDPFDIEENLPAPHFDKTDPEVSEKLHKKLAEAKNIYYKTRGIKDYNDFGVILMYNGKYEKALKIFQEIEEKSPGMYATAANLGTVNDLLNRNQQAHHWIARAIEINPASHHHSEWIHLKILEAKIQAEDNPNYYDTHNILGLDFGNDKIPVKNTQRDLHKTKKELYYQLGERMTFVEPKNPVIAQLLFDAGNIVAITDHVELALQIYDKAEEYGYSGSLFEQRKKFFQRLQAKADKQLKERFSIPTIYYWVIGIIIFIILTSILYGIIFIIKKYIRKKIKTN